MNENMDLSSRAVQLKMISRTRMVPHSGEDMMRLSLFGDMRQFPKRPEGPEEPAEPERIDPEDYPDVMADAIDDMIDRDTEGYGFPPQDWDEEDDWDGGEDPDELPDASEAIDWLRRLLENALALEDGGEDDTVEMVQYADGTMTRRALPDGGIELAISYPENDSMGDTVSTVTLSSTDPDTVVIAREGDTSNVLICEEGARHVTVFRTPMFCAEIAVVGRQVTSDVTYRSGGVLFLDYFVELHGAEVQHTQVTIEVRV